MGGDPDQAVKPAPPLPRTTPAVQPPTPGSVSGPVGGNALAGLDPQVSAPAPAPVVHFDPLRPWFYTVSGPWEISVVENALYGANLGKFEPVQRLLDPMTFGLRAERKVFPDLLRDPYRSQFHAVMGVRLDKDIERLESLLLDGDQYEAAEMLGESGTAGTVATYLRYWAEVKDVKTADGQRSYFDAFLARLKSDTWHTDYLLWNSKSHPYLDLLYSVGNPVEVHQIIGASSVEYGYYRPASVTVSQGQPAITAPNKPLDKDYVQRASNMIMDRLVGSTPARESHEIVELLTSLPGDVQALVLKNFVARYGSNETTGWIFSRSGEPGETDMLYWLFEDLTDDDRKKLADSFKATGVLKPDAVDALAEGRTWAGRNLPMTTHWGEKATEYWADRYNQGDSWAAVPGVFSALWTRQTATATILTLAGARVLPALGEMSPALGRALLVAGTGLGAFQTTIAAQDAITGKDVWTGKQLEFADRLGAILQAVSGAILLGAGFYSAATLPKPTTSLGPVAPDAPPQFEPRLVSADPESGEFTILVRDNATGEIASIQGNAHAGTATITNLSTGETIGYVRPGQGFGPPAPGGALPPPSGAPTVVVEPAAPPESEALTVPGKSGAPAAAPKPALPAPAPAALPAPATDNVAPTEKGSSWTPQRYWNGPAKLGRWLGVRGNSGWVSERPEVIRIVGRGPGGDANPVMFSQGAVDFGPWSQGELQVDGLNGEHANDMKLIRRAIADKFGLATGASNSAREKAALDFLRTAPDGHGGTGLAPHHAGGNRIQLIPAGLHNNVQHTDVSVYPGTP